jgi:peptide/nickel transport system ATP-binding protein
VTSLESASAAPLADETSTPLLDVRGLTTVVDGDGWSAAAVDDVSFSIGRGQIIGVVGESGSGKSLTALSILGLVAPPISVTSGSILFEGRDLAGLREREMRRIRGAEISMIFQEPTTSMDAAFTIGDQLVETIRAHRSVDRRSAEALATQMLDRVGIASASRRLRSYPHEFSGGMRQRVVIAIAIANQPEVIIADEPTTALDVTVQAQVLEVLKTAQDETGAATVLITHDLGVVAGMVDRVLVMYAGRAVEKGTVDDVFYRPKMPYSIGLLGSMPRIDAGDRQRLTPIKGAPPSLISPPPGCPFGPRCPLHYAKCDEQEPDLYQVDGPGHTAACIRVHELIATDVAAEDIFSDDSSDTTLAAAAAVGESALAEEGLGDQAAAGGVPLEPPPIPGVRSDAVSTEARQTETPVVAEVHRDHDPEERA